jgi:hypothetical protein
MLISKVCLSGMAPIVKLPDTVMFREITGRAYAQLTAENMDWCGVVEFAEVNDRGYGIMNLSAQDREGLERFREIIRQSGSGEISYETYPTATILKKHAISMFLHDGHYVRNDQIGPIFARRNPQLEGKFTIASVKELKTKEGRESTMPARVVTINGSAQFLKSLSKFHKNHKFKLGYKFVYLNGGVRADTSEASVQEIASAPELPQEQINDILKAHQDTIVSTTRRQEAERARYGGQ